MLRTVVLGQVAEPLGPEAWTALRHCLEMLCEHVFAADELHQPVKNVDSTNTRPRIHTLNYDHYESRVVKPPEHRTLNSDKHQKIHHSRLYIFGSLVLKLDQGTGNDSCIGRAPYGRRC